MVCPPPTRVEVCQRLLPLARIALLGSKKRVSIGFGTVWLFRTRMGSVLEIQTVKARCAFHLDGIDAHDRGRKTPTPSTGNDRQPSITGRDAALNPPHDVAYREQLFERGRAAVPELHTTENAVVSYGRIAIARLAANAHAENLADVVRRHLAL